VTEPSLRELFTRDHLLLAPGAHDAITAQLIERAGFPAVYMTGAGTVNAHLGLPDNGLGTMTEMVENAGRIADAVSVPVFCDADTGYGNATNVIRTVRAFERAGVAGVHLEDQEAPKRCGHLEGKRIVPVEEMVGRIRAAAEARRDDGFVVIARTDAAAVEGLEAAIDRAGHYVRAGADVVFTEALTERSDFGRFAAADVGAPLLANMTEFGRTPYLAVEDFRSLGYAAVIYPMTLLRTMLKAATDALAELANRGTQREMLDRMTTREELYDIVGYPEWEARERRYLGELARTIGPGAGLAPDRMGERR
jgi:methylisocitrate lyase